MRLFIIVVSFVLMVIALAMIPATAPDIAYAFGPFGALVSSCVLFLCAGAMAYNVVTFIRD